MRTKGPYTNYPIWADDAMKRAFQVHRTNSNRRGIPFLFSFEEWWAWWQVDNRWDNRGRTKGRYVMARIGDAGPYAPENVYCATSEQNIKDIDWSRRNYPQAARKRSHLAVRGEGHPRSRRVVTPLGKFGSAALAADRHGITRQHAAKLARSGTNGWTYD